MASVRGPQRRLRRRRGGRFAFLAPFLAAFGQPVLYSPGVADLFSGNTGDHHDVCLGELGEALHQHRKNNRVQIRAAGENLLTAGRQLAFRPHGQGEQVEQGVEVGVQIRGALERGTTSGRCSRLLVMSLGALAGEKGRVPRLGAEVPGGSGGCTSGMLRAFGAGDTRSRVLLGSIRVSTNPARPTASHQRRKINCVRRTNSSRAGCHCATSGSAKWGSSPWTCCWSNHYH